MSQVRILTDMAMIVLTIIFWLGLLFPPVVGTFWKWWRTSFGNSYVLKIISLSVVSSGIAIHEMFGIDLRALWFRWFILVGLVSIPVIIVWRGLVLWAEQRAGKSLSPVTAVQDWLEARRQCTADQEKDHDDTDVQPAR